MSSWLRGDLLALAILLSYVSGREVDDDDHFLFMYFAYEYDDVWRISIYLYISRNPPIVLIKSFA